jgi:hypothetical protein
VDDWGKYRDWPERMQPKATVVVSKEKQVDPGGWFYQGGRERNLFKIIQLVCDFCAQLTLDKFWTFPLTCRKKQGKAVKQPKPGTSSVELVGYHQPCYKILRFSVGSSRWHFAAKSSANDWKMGMNVWLTCALCFTGTTEWATCHRLAQFPSSFPCGRGQHATRPWKVFTLLRCRCCHVGERRWSR